MWSAEFFVDMAYLFVKAFAAQYAYSSRRWRLRWEAACGPNSLAAPAVRALSGFTIMAAAREEHRGRLDLERAYRKVDELLPVDLLTLDSALIMTARMIESGIDSAGGVSWCR